MPWTRHEPLKLMKPPEEEARGKRVEKKRVGGWRECEGQKVKNTTKVRRKKNPTQMSLCYCPHKRNTLYLSLWTSWQYVPSFYTLYKLLCSHLIANNYMDQCCWHVATHVMLTKQMVYIGHTLIHVTAEQLCVLNRFMSLIILLEITG